MRERSGRFALFIVLFSLILCSVTGDYAWAGSAPAPEKAERLSALLHGKLEKLRSFEAEYLAEGREKSMVIKMVLNRKQNYAVLKVASPDGEEIPAMVYEGGKSPRLLIFSQGPGAATEITLEDLKSAAGRRNPFTLFLEALKTMGVKLSDQDILPRAESLMPAVNLTLGRENLTLALGLTANRPAFSWAEQAQLARAERIEQRKREVVVHYSRDHRVVIDAATGLLREDVWKARGVEKQRSIILRKYSPMDGAAPLAAHLPQLASITKEKPTPDVLYDLYYSLFLSRAADALERGKGVEKALREKKSEFQGAVRSLSKDYWSGLINQAFMDQMMRSLFEKIAPKPGDPEMTYESFLERVSGQGDFPGKVAANLLRDMTPAPPEEIERHLENVPEKQRKLLKEIYDTGIRAYEESFADAVKDALRKYLQEKSGKKEAPFLRPGGMQ